MHLIWENLIPNLISLWTGTFKGLDVGTHSYQLAGSVWEAVGKATSCSADTIPSIFGPRLGDISQDWSTCTADAWSFWTLYIAPVLLRRRFTHIRYFNHFVDLIRLLRLCLQFELSTTEIAQIRRGFIKWVQQYEKFYYQNDPDRLSTCPVTVHALLHIADSIEAIGPVWAYWAFPMERFCGQLQPAIKSRRFPWASIENHLIGLARITQVKLLYNMHDELVLRPPRDYETLTRGERRDPAYPMTVLCPPCRLQTVDKGLHDKIVGAIVTRLDSEAGIVRRHVPTEIEHWGKVRIINGGDTIHAASLVKRLGDRRDQTYVRYEIYVDKNTRKRRRRPVYELQTFYGRLEHIFHLRFESPAALTDLGLDRPTTILLAAVRTCAITASDHRLDIHFYKQYGPLDVMDIQCIQCVVGRVPDSATQGWGLIDRSGSLARALAIDDT
ncbi:hypothetical protein C8Q76DRAFT_634372 [Earliella scabrosa]|nr:hypothetical protein C8Q76DRAFT_634372 [Earliella scabrosa]